MSRPSNPAERSWTFWRRCSQAGIGLFYLALPVAAIKGVTAVAGSLASLRLGPVDLTEPAAGFSAALAAWSVPAALVIGLVPVVALALTLGPVYCSWVCPWGAVSEGLDRLRFRRARRTWAGQPWVRARRVRPAVLVLVLALSAVLGVPLAALISAPRLLTTLPLEVFFLRVCSPVTGGLLLALVAYELMGPRRSWCRMLCPVGALANYLRTPRTLTVQFDHHACLCPPQPQCHAACAWGIDPRAMMRYDGCTNCLACIDRCPSGSLTAAFVPAVERPARRMAAGARNAVVLLLAAVSVCAAQAPKPVTQPAPAPAQGSVVQDPAPLRLGTLEVTVEGVAPAAQAARVTPADDVPGARLTAADLAVRVPGVTLTQIGTRNERGLLIRGFDLRQVPVLLDGVPISVPYDGYTDLGRFDVTDIAELQVASGLGSVVYGANALGGAVNLISRRPGPGWAGLARAESGVGGLRAASVSAGTQQGRWFGTGFAAMSSVRTFPISAAFGPARGEDGGDRDNAASNDADAQIRLGVTARGGDEYALRMGAQRASKGQPPYAGADPQVRVRYWRWPVWDKDTAALLSRTALGPTMVLQTRTYVDTASSVLDSFDDAGMTTQVRPSSFRSLYADRSLGTSMELGMAPGARHSLRAVLHGRLDDHHEHNRGEPERVFRQRLISVALEDQVAAGAGLTVTMGIAGDVQTTTRADHFTRGAIEPFPTGAAGGAAMVAAISKALGGGTILRAGVSHKTRLPTIKDRYSYRMGQSVPNPDLQPERAWHVEAGASASAGPLNLHAAVFDSEIADLIDRVYLSPVVYRLQNVGRARHVGFEGRGSLRHGRTLQGSVTYSFVARRGLTPGATPLPDVPRHRLDLSGTLALGSTLTVAGSGIHERGRINRNDAGTLLPLPSYWRVDLRATVRLHRRFDAAVTVQNIGDVNVLLADGYPEPGRQLGVSAVVRF